MEVVQSFGMPLVNCQVSHAYNSVGSTTDLYTFSFVSSLIPLRSQILPRSRPNTVNGISYVQDKNTNAIYSAKISLFVSEIIRKMSFYH